MILTRDKSKVVVLYDSIKNLHIKIENKKCKSRWSIAITYSLNGGKVWYDLMRFQGKTEIRKVVVMGNENYLTIYFPTKRGEYELLASITTTEIYPTKLSVN